MKQTGIEKKKINKKKQSDCKRTKTHVQIWMTHGCHGCEHDFPFWTTQWECSHSNVHNTWETNTNEMYPVCNFWFVHINHQKSKLTANMIATSTYLKPAYFRQNRGSCFPLHVDGHMCFNCQSEIFSHTNFFDVPSGTTKENTWYEEQHRTYF